MSTNINLKADKWHIKEFSTNEQQQSIKTGSHKAESNKNDFMNLHVSTCKFKCYENICYLRFQRYEMFSP